MSFRIQEVNGDFSPFKKFESILNNKLEPYRKKIVSLVEVWKSVSQCSLENPDIRYMVQIMDWAKLHTLNIVLTGKWKSYKAEFEQSLLSEVEKTLAEMTKVNDFFMKRFKKLVDVIRSPWDDPVLANLLHGNNAPIGPAEIEFFCVETAYLVSVRLKKLCESQCEDLALNLVTAFMNFYNLSLTQDNINLNATKTQILFIFDIHVALLYRYNKMAEIVALFKKLSLDEGLQLIRRFAKKRIKISKVWRNYTDITFLAAQVFVTAAVTKPVDESGNILKNLLDVWISFSLENTMFEKLEASVRRIIQASTDAQHIYTCCDIIHSKIGLKMKTFAIELYIRALTTDMNNLESQKNENDSEKVDYTTKSLANGFYRLADILKDNVQVSRECALTAFSLEPTLERLRRIEDLARVSGFQVLDTGQIWECKLHPPVLQSDELTWVCNACGKWMSKPNLDLRLTTNFALNEALNFETLGISPQLCDDLAVVLNGPRYHLLSWLLNWQDLHRLCEMYLNDMERTKNLVTDLKFVDIDYSMFASVKREPVDELAGIEKGYERYLYSDTGEQIADIVQVGNTTPPASPAELPAQRKSDPNTLKTLRMFRHNIKRNRPPGTESNNPYQVPQPSSPSSAASSSYLNNPNRVVCTDGHLLSQLPPGSYLGKLQEMSKGDLTIWNKLPSPGSPFKTPQDNNTNETTTLNHKAPSDSDLGNYPDGVNGQDKGVTEAEIPNPRVPSVSSLTNPQENMNEVKRVKHKMPHLRDPKEILKRQMLSVSPSLPQTTPQQNANGSSILNHDLSSSRSLLRIDQDKRTKIPDHQLSSRNILVNPREPANARKVLSHYLKDPHEKEAIILNHDLAHGNYLGNNPRNRANGMSLSTHHNKRKSDERDKLTTAGNCIHNSVGYKFEKIQSDSKKSKTENGALNGYRTSKGREPTALPPPPPPQMEPFNLEQTAAGHFLSNNSFQGRAPSITPPIQSRDDTTPTVEDTPEGKLKLDKEAQEISDVGALQRELDLTSDALKVLLIDGDDGTVQNENSSKNANCPPEITPKPAEGSLSCSILLDKIDNGTIKLEDKPVASPPDVFTLFKDLRNLSNRHSPIIVVDDEKPIKEEDDDDGSSDYQCLKLSSDSDDGDVFEEEVPNSSTNKELKIILHRLSNEVIKSFVPSYGVDEDRRCPCRKKKKRCICSFPNFKRYPPKRRWKHDKRMRKRCRKNGDTYKKTAENQKNYSNNDGKKQKNTCDRKRDEYKIETAMNPRVVLERLSLDSDYVRSVLSNVPGLNDFEMIRPVNVDQIVNVVQISGARPVTTGPVQITQTSTQISPHIQRIGQPRSDKPTEQPNNSEITTVTSTSTPISTAAVIKPSTSQPSALINILSQQIIRPGQSNCVRNRTSPLINILSQQIIRPANATQVVSSKVVQTEVQPNVTQQKVETVAGDVTKAVTTTAKGVTTTTTVSGQSAIVQFICSKSTLPKFQQAFGKSVYQNNTETTDATTTCTTETTNSDGNKSPVKTSPVNIQPIQSGVIYTRQMPVGQTINFLPPGRGQVFRIATSSSDQISLVKESVIHSKMSVLLAAALQGKKTAEAPTDGETVSEDSTRVTVARPTLVQNARIVKPVLQIPSNVIRTSPQSNLSSTTLEQLREFDMVYKQIKERSSTTTPNTSESNASSDSNNENNPQRISVTYLNQQGQKYTQLSPVVVVSSYCNLQPAASPALSVTSQGSSSPCVTPAPTPSAPKVSSKSSKGKTVKSTTTQASKASPIPKPQQKPQEDEHTTQRIFDILAEYAEQLRNSPDLNNKPAPRRRSNPPTNPSQNSKRKKSSSSKNKSGQCSSMVSEADVEDHRTVGSEDSSCGVVQISVQEEEQTHTANVTTESNDSGSSRQLILTEAGGTNATRNLIIADSSVGEALKMPNTAVLVPGNYIMPVSMVKGGQQIAVVSGGSKILATVPARSGPNMLLFQSFLNQNRKSGVPTVKYSAIQPISGISSQSIASVGGQQGPVILPQNSHNLTAVTLGQPITLKKIEEPSERVNTELLLTISQPNRETMNASSETTQPDSSSNAITSTVSNVELEETIVNSDNSSEKVYTYQKTIPAAPIATPVIAQTSCSGKEEATNEQQNATRNTITLEVRSDNNKEEPPKVMERVQSVLVTACTSNGPMLSHTPPRYRKPAITVAVTNAETSTKEEFIQNGEKPVNNEQKQFQSNATYFQTKKKPNPQRLDRELYQLCLQRKQAALERELRLQKSLSEECEDLGVDEPSTSDLFPEADILFDSNHSPSFDQSSQDLVKRPQQELLKEAETKAMTLFSDDDNSGSLRTDFLFESVEYQSPGAELEYVQTQQLTNGQSSASNASGSSCEDHTLLQNCASMSDVTLHSPVSPDLYNDANASTLNKYKFKYSNRRKNDRHGGASGGGHHHHKQQLQQQQSETWTGGEVSSSEDTTGSTELGKSSSHSPESCTNKRSHSVSCDDELSDGGGYKVVRVAISKSELLKDEESCEGMMHCDDDLDCSPSGRGARRSVKKMCPCCNNGSQEGAGVGGATGGGGAGGGASRKRPHTPVPHKKAFLNKKR